MTRLVIFAIVLAVAVVSAGIARFARGGELVQCAVKRGDPALEWHYRTKIPGYDSGTKDDKCWYVGKRMKPRDELFWSESVIIMVPEIEPTLFEHRFRGEAPEGWDAKE
jgi:hypothetical protein